MRLLKNVYRAVGMWQEMPPMTPPPSVEVAPVRALWKKCRPFAPKRTPLIKKISLAKKCGVNELWIKDERARMGLGSFKGLGAGYAIARDADEAADPLTAENAPQALRGKTYVAASAGNHGLSVAAAANNFGASAVIFISRAVPDSFAQRLRARGAKVEVAGGNYEESMEAAAQFAESRGFVLLADSSWAGYFEMPRRVMQGYLVIAYELVLRMRHAPPTHIFLQAGVGGLAASISAYVRRAWPGTVKIVVVEPERAAALQTSVLYGRPQTAPGPPSAMGRLDCKTPSAIALGGLARDADWFVTISEEEAAAALPALKKTGLATTESGGAGVAALLIKDEDMRIKMDITEKSNVLCVITEAKYEDEDEGGGEI